MPSNYAGSSGNTGLVNITSAAETIVLTTDTLEPGTFARIMLSTPNNYNGTLTVRRGTGVTGTIVYQVTRKSVFLPSTVLVLDDAPASEYTVTVSLGGYNFEYAYPVNVAVTAFVDQF